MAVLGIAAGPTLCATINLATGLNSSGNLTIASGQSDADWTVQEQNSTIGAGSVVQSTDADFPAGWLADGPNSAWIARSAATNNNGAAPYSFFRTFDLTGDNLTAASISGAMWTIDDVGTLSINGTQIGSLSSGGPWTSLHAFTLPVADLLPGLNTLEITITQSDQDYEGVRLEGSITASPLTSGVPEPSTCGLLLSGLGLVAGVTERKFQKH